MYHAMEELKIVRSNGVAVSAGMLNCILSAAAERGDIDQVVSILEEFPKNNLQPDADSFGYALESLGKHLHRRSSTAPASVIADCLDQADSFLAAMEEDGIAPTGHIVRNYVELLCITGQLDIATDIVLEEASSREGGDGARVVNSKAVHCVAMANAKRGNFRDARRIVSCFYGSGDAAATGTTGAIPFLLECIESEEKRQQFNLLSEERTET